MIGRIILRSDVIRKIWNLLSPIERRRTAVLVVLMFIGTGLEMLGVGLVVPALALITRPDYARGHPVIESFLGALGNPTQDTLVIGGMLVLVGIYSIKALFFTFFSWYQFRLAFGIRAAWSTRLFSIYLRQPYTFHLQRNSAQLIQNIAGQVDQFANSIFVPTMSMLVESLVFAGLILMLIAIEPVGTMILVCVLSIIALVFYWTTRKKLLRWGEAAQYHDGQRFQHLMQGLGGVKDVKLLGREDEFLAQYGHHSMKGSRISRWQFTFQQLPRLWLELLAVAGMAALVMALLAQGLPLVAILPTLAMFAAAAFRLLPAVNRILVTTQVLRFGLPVIENLHVEFNLPTPVVQASDRIPFRQALEVQDVVYTYVGAEQRALDHVSLTIQCGECVGFVGTSGAGKSTLVDILLGLLVPDTGKVCVDGKEIVGNPRQWQDQIGYVPQSIFLTDDSLRRNVAFGLANEQIDEGAVRRALHAAQLEEFVHGLPNGLDTVVGERGIRLSGGQRQRIGIARALYHDPAVLVLDEATSALDMATERGVMDAVKVLQGSKTVLIVAHRLSTVQNCERIYRFEKGRLVDVEVKSAMRDKVEEKLP